jgi:hypothetical protein
MVFQQRTAQDWIDSLLNSTRSFKEELTSILILFHKTDIEGILTNPFYEISITLIAKLIRR